MELEKFNPTVAELKKLVEESNKIVIVDTSDKKQIELVKDTRISLKNARVLITKKGKELREEALKYQKDVIAKEKELIGIIEPEELRLEKFEQEYKDKKTKEDRIVLLPERRDKLSKIGDSVSVDDEELLGMDSAQFTEHVNNRVSAKNEFDRIVIEERERKAKEEDLRLQREKETREREEIARKQEQEKAEQRIKIERELAEKRVIEERERFEREQKAKEAKDKQDKIDVENKVKAENERLNKEKKYQSWLKENGYTKETANDFLVKDNGNTVSIYKFVSTYTK